MRQAGLEVGPEAPPQVWQVGGGHGQVGLVSSEGGHAPGRGEERTDTLRASHSGQEGSEGGGAAGGPAPARNPGSGTGAPRWLWYRGRDSRKDRVLEPLLRCPAWVVPGEVLASLGVIRKDDVKITVPLPQGQRR